MLTKLAIGRGCCQEPPPICPNGGRAFQRCNRGADCPPGFGCTPLGGCCLLSMEPVCPPQSTPICQCSPNRACPMGATCTMGTCCAAGLDHEKDYAKPANKFFLASALAQFSQIPGSKCQASTQCNGYMNSCAQCTQGICACVNGAASNGASCLQMPAKTLILARNGCDQYGSPCNVYLSSARRKPIIAPVGNITETPLFFNVAKERQCVSNSTIADFDPDSTCLPNEKCIDGVCRMKLWPGEYGCISDEECSSRCVNTYCERKKSDKNVAQCQCRDGLLLFGRCFKYDKSLPAETGHRCRQQTVRKVAFDLTKEEYSVQSSYEMTLIENGSLILKLLLKSAKLSQCPQGFHESGAYCMYDNEDLFWADGDAQDRIKALLNASPC
ncbi:unnamed protein product [Cylicostephanus goldi]|uniref:EB domain-containing protein n=1 Tax=Cylicostephanus goldi TaxID=71465 RepID=A0A3P6RYF3_CYLGO|nr:unnamed protein product [Cylicostephanus goldi]